VVAALGITWVLDGLEVTLAGSIAGALEASPRLRFTASDIGLASSFYLAGAVIGALGFGWMTDRLGRRLLFFITLGLYLISTAATAFAWNLESFCLFRMLTGAGIGGEYSAVNSTIQEMIPARFRGWTDLAINGSFWIGGALGAAASIFVLDPTRFDPDLGWRLAFFIGSALGLVIFFLRTWIPESPRWLVIHGREQEAEKVVDDIEAGFRLHGASFQNGSTLTPMRLHPRTHTPLREVFHTLFITFRVRTLVALALMMAQAFFYNAIFFTYALVLTNFYDVPSHNVGWYILPFALGNVLGPLLLGPLFDSIGRKPMIAFTLCGFWFAACRKRLAVRASSSRRDAADNRLDGNFLFCVLGGGSRLFDGVRDLSGGNPRARHCLFLRGRHCDRRCGSAVSIWRPDCNRLACQRFRRLSVGFGAYGPGRHYRDDLGRGSRAQTSGNGSASLVVGERLKRRPSHARFGVEIDEHGGLRTASGQKA
jgi:MFS family permease